MAKNQVIRQEHVFIDVPVASKEECLRMISKKAVELGICSDADAVYEGFMVRESEGETGIEDGFAIPHTRCEAVQKSGVIFVKSQQPVEWESMDDQPIQVMIALLVPKGGNNEHIHLLAALSRVLIKQEFRDVLKASTSEEEIYQIISDAMGDSEE